MSNSSRGQPGSAVRTAWNVAESQGIADDLDTIKEVETDGDGVTVRALWHEAATETESVGIQVTRPPESALNGDTMFRRRLRNGLRELKREMRGDRADSGADTDESQKDGAEAGSSGANPGGSVDETGSQRGAEADLDTDRTETGSSHELSVELDMRLTDDSLEALRDELNTLEEDRATRDAEIERLRTDVDDLTERITAVEAQLEQLETSLSALAQLTEDE